MQCDALSRREQKASRRHFSFCLPAAAMFQTPMKRVSQKAQVTIPEDAMRPISRHPKPRDAVRSSEMEEITEAGTEGS